MAGRQVLVRRLLQGGNAKLVRCDVIGQNDDGTLRCKCEDRRAMEEVQASATIPAAQIHPFGNRAQTATPIIQKQQPGRNSLAGLLAKYDE